MGKDSESIGVIDGLIVDIVDIGELICGIEGEGEALTTPGD